MAIKWYGKNIRQIVTTVHADLRATCLLVVHLLGVEDVPGEEEGAFSQESWIAWDIHDRFNASRDLEHLCMSLPMRRTHT